MKMTRNERYELIRDIAQAVKDALSHTQTATPIPDSPMVTLHEAARILGYSDSHMRKLKDKYPHLKQGSTPQGRLLFYRDKLIQSFGEK